MNDFPKLLEPIYEPMQGLRATMVDGAESLLRQGEYYIAQGQLVMKCPVCRFDNLIPRTAKYKTANWIQRLLGIRKGLQTQKLHCYHCEYGFYSANGEYFISKEPIHG